MQLLIAQGTDPLDREAEDALESEFPTCRIRPTASPADAEAMCRTDPDDGRILLMPNAPDDAAIADWQRAAPVVVISTDETRATVIAAIRAGAMSFITAGTGAHPLLTAMRVILQGGVWMPPAIIERRAPDRPGYGTWVPAPRTPAEFGLSPAQAAVLRSYVAGRPNARIAHDLALTDAELESHLATLSRKLDASGRLPVVLAVARLGLRLPSTATPS